MPGPGEYPEGHESPFAAPGTRQGLGMVRIGRQGVQVETKAPSWAGRFADYLEVRFPGDVLLMDVEWKPWQDAFESRYRGMGATAPDTRGKGSRKQTFATKKSGPASSRSRSSTPGTLYSLKVSLVTGPVSEDFDEISRTIEIGGQHTLEDLHGIITEAFDREDDHLWMFYFRKRNSRVVARRYVAPQMELPDAEEGGDACETTIDTLGLRSRSKFFYLFDIGDYWDHELVVQKVENVAAAVKEPRIVGRVGKSPEQYPDEDRM